MSIKNPRPAPPGPRLPRSGIGAARDHVIRPRQGRASYRGIAAAGPAPGTVPGDSRVDAGGTRLRLRALHVMGHGSARIARAAGAHPRTIRALVRGESRTVSVQLRELTTDLYDAWWDKRAPARTRFERGAATAARKRAIAGDWCAAAALDDDQLDTPGYRPPWGWKPATGTGTAPDRPLATPPPRKERRMTRDDRIDRALIYDVIDLLKHHGYRPHDTLQPEQVAGAISDLTGVYEGNRAPSPGTEPGDGTVTLSAAELNTVRRALDNAAWYTRNETERCSFCGNQSCRLCQRRFERAGTYADLAADLIQPRQTARPAPARESGPDSPDAPPGPPRPAAGREAGP
jgi:hypothetical protein